MPNSREQEINELLDRLNPAIFGSNSKLKLRYVRFDQLREQDINANVMPTGMFNALVSNVSKHGALESIPLCATREASPDRVEVVSGHHRTRAARQAGLEGGVVLLYEGLSNSEIRAKQLAHNSINGSSDPEIVKAIFEEIEGLDERMESFIDPTVYDNLPSAVKFDMVDIDPLADAKTATVVFLPTQIQDFQTAVDLLTDQPDVVYLAHRDVFDQFKQAVHEVKDELEIVSQPTAFAAMARLALERLAQIRQVRSEREEAARAAGEPAPERELPSVELDRELLDALRG